MTEVLRPDLCVLGGGIGGIAAATEAAKLGAQVILVEKRALGGAHLTQAIPVEAFCGAALARRNLSSEPADLPALRAHIKANIAHFARLARPARLAALNMGIIRAAGSFSSATRLEAGGFAIDARYFIVATGSLPAPAPIAGLEFARPLEPEALAGLESLPSELAVIGASRRELSLAQAFLRLGSKVSLVVSGTILPEEDQELVLPVLASLRREGLTIHEYEGALKFEPLRAGVRIIPGKGPVVDATHVIVGPRLLPCVEGFGLKAARVAYGLEGIEADAEGRTSNPRIYAVGGVLGGSGSGVLTQHQGEFVAAALFGQRRPAPLVARILATDPEMATVGLSELAARARHKQIRVIRAPFSENARALGTFGRSGHVKIVTNSHGLILGAGIVGPQARELIGIFTLAIAKQMKASDFDAIVANAPTLAEALRAAALASVPQVGKT